MKSRMELAELAIQRQRDRKAKEQAVKEEGGDNEEADGGGKVRTLGHCCAMFSVRCPHIVL